jgi:hypothetical protein
MTGWWMIMNRKEFGRKQSWRYRGVMRRHFLEVLSKTKKHLWGWLVSRPKFGLITSRIWVSGVTVASNPSVQFVVDGDSKGTLREYMEIASFLCTQRIKASVNNIQTKATFELVWKSDNPSQPQYGYQNPSFKSVSPNKTTREHTSKSVRSSGGSWTVSNV